MKTYLMYRQVREELKIEAVEFVKEQRIRCLLQGAWFTSNRVNKSEETSNYKTNVSRGREKTLPTSWRFVRMSQNRRHLHWADFDLEGITEPRLEELVNKSMYAKLILPSLSFLGI